MIAILLKAVSGEKTGMKKSKKGIEK